MKEKLRLVTNIKKENIIYILLFLVLVLLLVSQLGMKFLGLGRYFSAVETFEGKYIGDDGLIRRAEVVLEFVGDIPEDVPEIYSNGERIAFFDEKEKVITIETDTTIEVFCKDDTESVSVKISSQDSGVTLVSDKSHIPLKPGFNVVGRFLFK